MVLDESKLNELQLSKGLEVNAEQCNARELRCTNPRCPHPLKGFSDSLRKRKLSANKKAKLDEEGQNTEALKCLRCKSCKTYRSPRSTGNFI